MADLEMEDQLLSLAEAVRVLGVSRRTVTRWVELGLLAAVNTADGPRFKRSDLDAVRVPLGDDPE